MSYEYMNIYKNMNIYEYIKKELLVSRIFKWRFKSPWLLKNFNEKWNKIKSSHLNILINKKFI